MHSASIFGLGAKTKIGKLQPPPTPNFDSLTLPLPEGRMVKIFFAKMTAKEDPTISCNHLVAETSVLAAWKKVLKGVVTTPCGIDEG